MAFILPSIRTSESLIFTRVTTGYGPEQYCNPTSVTLPSSALGRYTFVIRGDKSKMDFIPSGSQFSVADGYILHKDGTYEKMTDATNRTTQYTFSFPDNCIAIQFMLSVSYSNLTVTLS